MNKSELIIIALLASLVLGSMLYIREEVQKAGYNQCLVEDAERVKRYGPFPNVTVGPTP